MTEGARGVLELSSLLSGRKVDLKQNPAPRLKGGKMYVQPCKYLHKLLRSSAYNLSFSLIFILEHHPMALPHRQQTANMPRKDIEFKTSDHVVLRGGLYTPSESKGKLPCLVMAHG
jgi:hypothetical protein